MTFLPVFPRQKKHTNLWLFSQFSDGTKNDIQTSDFFPSFRTAKKTTYKPMTFFTVFGRHKKRHTNLWLFSQFSDGKKNDIQTNLWLFSQFSDGKKKRHTNLWLFFTSFQTTYKPMTFLPVFKRQNFVHNCVEHRIRWRSRQPVSLIIWRSWVQPTQGAWLSYQFSNDILTYDFFTSFQTTYKPMTFLPVFKRHTNLWLFYQFSNDILTYDFFPSFRTAKKTTYKPMTFFPVFGRQKKRHTNLWLFCQFSDGKKNDIQTYDFFPSFQTGSFRACWRSRQPVSLIIWRLWVQPSQGAWLSHQFSNDILTYDFFTSFQTTY